MTYQPTRDSATMLAPLGTNGTTITDSATTVLGPMGANNANNAFDSSLVTPDPDGSMLERNEAIQAGLPGSQFSLTINVASNAIPSNTQTGGAITATCPGSYVVEDIIFETGSTGVAGPTNVEITTNNASGLNSAALPLVLQAIAGLGANKTVVAKTSSTTKILPFTVESGKQIFIDGDDGAGTGAGNLRLTLIGRRCTANKSLAAGGSIGT